jgi:hypothetical protein
MQWIKANLNLVVTILIGVLGITGIALGMVMSDVDSRMKQDESTLSGLSSTKGTNVTVIEEVRKHTDDVKKQLDDGLKKFESIGTHTPILPDVFPKITASNATAPYKFGPAYKKVLQEMLDKLHAKDAPNDADYRQAKQAIDDEMKREEREKKLGKDPNLSKTRPAAQTTSRPVVNAPVAPVVPQQGRPGLMTPAELVKHDERAKASVKRAREIYCYANFNSFMLPDMLSKDEAPSVESMWYAQMVLWIEQDIVDALAGVNQAVADKLPAGQKPWVGNLPVKHLAKIVVGNYLPAPAAAVGTSFTNRGSQGRVDVIQFTIELYLNPEYLPTVIKAISQMGFFTPLLLNYEAEPPTADLYGYVYGSQPVIHATLQFEGCFLRSKYESWMPDAVKTAILEGRAGMSTAQGGAGSPVGGAGPTSYQRPMHGAGMGERNR